MPHLRLSAVLLSHSCTDLQSLPSHSARRRISASELAEAVHARDEAAYLVEPRVLRRVIKADRDITTLGLQVPHRKSYVVHGDRPSTSKSSPSYGAFIQGS